MAKVNLEALNDPTVSFELVEPRTTGFWLTFASLAFVLIGVFIMLPNQNGEAAIAWGTILFFGLCLVVGLLKLFGKPDTLRLEKDGFTFTNLAQSHSMKWEQFSRFGTYRNGLPLVGLQMVGMIMSESSKAKGSGFANSLFGFDGALPSSYGVHPKVLATALQRRLDAYTSQTQCS